METVVLAHSMFLSLLATNPGIRRSSLGEVILLALISRWEGEGRDESRGCGSVKCVPSGTEEGAIQVLH